MRALNTAENVILNVLIATLKENKKKHKINFNNVLFNPKYSKVVNI